MKIKIEDGKPSVEFLKSEARSLSQSVRLCDELGKWLKDENGKLAAERLRDVIADYLPEEKIEEIVGSEIVTESDGEPD